MIPILNSSANGWVNGSGSAGGFERLNTGIFFIFYFIYLFEFEFEFDSCTMCVCGFITFSLFFLHNFCFVKGNRVFKKKKEKKDKVFFLMHKKKRGKS